MADGNESNFGNADGGGVVDLNNDGRNLDAAASNGEPGSPHDPLKFSEAKRGRGRPRKDAGTPSGPNGPTAAKQQAGKNGGGKTSKLDVDLFARQIVGAHAMLALVTKKDIFIINENEAKNLAQALLDVMGQHAIDIDPRTVAYMKLLAVCAMIYGPRVMMLKHQANAEKSRTVEMPN